MLIRNCGIQQGHVPVANPQRAFSILSGMAGANEEDVENVERTFLRGSVCISEISESTGQRLQGEDCESPQTPVLPLAVFRALASDYPSRHPAWKRPQA